MTLPRTLTYGTMLDLATAVATVDEANALLVALVRRAQQENPSLSDDEALTRCRSNLGYLAGYCGVDVQRRFESLFGAAHPIFGPVGGDKEPKTPGEAFAMGMAMARGAE